MDYNVIAEKVLINVISAVLAAITIGVIAPAISMLATGTTILLALLRIGTQVQWDIARAVWTLKIAPIILRMTGSSGTIDERIEEYISKKQEEENEKLDQKIEEAHKANERNNVRDLDEGYKVEMRHYWRQGTGWRAVVRRWLGIPLWFTIGEYRRETDKER